MVYIIKIFFLLCSVYNTNYFIIIKSRRKYWFLPGWFGLVAYQPLQLIKYQIMFIHLYFISDFKKKSLLITLF